MVVGRCLIEKKPYEISLDYFKKYAFNRALKNPFEWIMTALSLRMAAKALQAVPIDENPDYVIQRFGTFTTPVYRFLMARSTENLIKGIIIARGVEIGSKGRIEKWFKSHDLVRLSEYLGIKVTDDDRKIMEILRLYAVWAGDYPIPATYDKYQPGVLVLELKESKMLELWHRLANHLYDSGWIVQSDGGKLPLKSFAPELLRNDKL